MRTPPRGRPRARLLPDFVVPERALFDQAFSRAAGAPLVTGNHVRLLRDATENYPAWLDAIRSAERTVYFENYLVDDDEAGAEFAAALAARAREGVSVRLIYDWVGALGRTSGGFWRRLADAGVEVRCFNPPRFTSPIGWIRRDHRKMVAVDGRIGFVTGLCVGRRWVGDPARGIAPWRDTGLEVRGPAVDHIERAFAQVWAALGSPIPDAGSPPGTVMEPAGDVALRVVASAPGSSGLLRLDYLVAAAATESLWLTDAYFAGTPSYIQSLRAAALDGVDVRLLAPGTSNHPLLRRLSEAGYRPLLAAGVRIFEWNGPMMHAKTAVADGRWGRVGSSNLNMASWFGNYELDVVIEDEQCAAAMRRMFLEDLANATEIVLSVAQRGRAVDRPQAKEAPDGPGAGHHPRPTSDRTGRVGAKASRVAAGALRLGSTVGAAISDQRMLVSTEAMTIAWMGGLLLSIAIVSVLWPFVVAIPLAGLAAWVAVALFAKAYVVRQGRRVIGEGPAPGASKLPAAGIAPADWTPAEEADRSPGWRSATVRGGGTDQ